MKNYQKTYKSDMTVQKQADRLKAELKKARLSYQAFADLTGYAQANSVGMLCNGYRRIQEKDFERFAGIISAHLKDHDYVTADYLRGKSDVRNDYEQMNKDTEKLFALADRERDERKTVLHLLEMSGYVKKGVVVPEWSRMLEDVKRIKVDGLENIPDDDLPPSLYSMAAYYGMDKYSSVDSWIKGESLTAARAESCLADLARIAPEHVAYTFETPDGVKTIPHADLERLLESVKATAAALAVVEFFRL